MAEKNGKEQSFDWLLVQGRWVVLASVLAAAFLRQGVGFHQLSVLHIVFLGFIYNGALYIWLRVRRPGPRFWLSTLAGDLVLVTLLVYLSGGVNSPFHDLFYLVVIAAAVQRGVAGGLEAALASSVLVVSIELVTPSGRSRLADIDRVLSSVPYQFLVALAAGILSRQLSLEGDRRRQAEVQARTLELEQQRRRIELEVAQAVQAALLPAELPQIPGIDIAARTVTALEVGGDLFDFSYDPSDTVMAAVIDVSGKGVPAALALSGLKSSLDASHRLNLPAALASLNRHMVEHTPEDMFATMAICTLDAGTRTLQLACAGHEPMLIVRAADGTRELATTEGLPLGIRRDGEYRASQVQLAPGDVVALYTDGVTEAQCGGQPFGVEGLADIIAENRSASAQALVDAVFARLGADCACQDDATVVILKLTGGRPESEAGDER